MTNPCPPRGEPTMNRKYIYLAPAIALLACQRLSAAEGWSIHISAPQGMVFRVVEGQPVLVRDRDQWRSGDPLDIRNGTQLVHFSSDKTLTYSLSGDSPLVTLGNAKDVSSKWDFPPGGTGGESVTFPIRAAEGKFKGWYLDWSDDTEMRTHQGQLLHVRRFVLIHEPKTHACSASTW